jgi:hypothetical protein
MRLERGRGMDMGMKVLDALLSKLCSDLITDYLIKPPPSCLPIFMDQAPRSKLLKEMPTLDVIDVTMWQARDVSWGVQIPGTDAASGQRGAGMTSSSSKGKEKVATSGSIPKVGSQSPPGRRPQTKMSQSRCATLVVAGQEQCRLAARRLPHPHQATVIGPGDSGNGVSSAALVGIEEAPKASLDPKMATKRTTMVTGSSSSSPPPKWLCVTWTCQAPDMLCILKIFFFYLFLCGFIDPVLLLSRASDQKITPPPQGPRA